MLTFKNTNIVFVVLLIVTILLHAPILVYVLLFFLYSLILMYGCCYIQSNFFIHSVCSADTNEKLIAISFDDGPAVSYTPQILQILKQHNVEVTFFCIGKNIEGNENILQQIIAEGHLIGNHSYSHGFWFDLLSSKKMLQDLKQTDDAIKKVTGLQPKLFRPPYGVINPNVKKAIIKGSYTSVGWSVRSLDTTIKDEEKLLDKINSKLHPGAIYLFHDTSSTTLAVLSAFLQNVKKNGYKIIRLDKMLILPPYV